MSQYETIQEIVDALILANPDKVEQVKTKPANIGWFVGKGMLRSQGTADPAKLTATFVERLIG